MAAARGGSEGPGAAGAGSFLPTGAEPPLLEAISRELEGAASLDMAVAFVGRGGINLVQRPLARFLDRGGKVRVLTSLMGHFNDIGDLRAMEALLPGTEIRAYAPGGSAADPDIARKPPSFHPKCWLFRGPARRSSLLIGSSNLTMGGLKSNVEWNYLASPAEADDEAFRKAADLFDAYWEEHSLPLGHSALEEYERIREARRDRERRIAEAVPEEFGPPSPNGPQREALARIAAKRAEGVARTAVIAATGIGKTYLAAFDFAASGMERVLFVAHRRAILAQAREAFRRVLGDPGYGVVLDQHLSGPDRERAEASARGIFAMVQTLSRDEALARMDPRRFDYIVVDEFHHAEAASYRRLLGHFRPRFLLGLTATPERLDGKDVLASCDYDVAYEARLFQAIDRGWLAPFQYFAIHDPTDYTRIRWNGNAYDEGELAEALSTDTRAQLAAANFRRFLPASGKPKALAFCSSRSHALYMAARFADLGVPATTVLGDTPDEDRERALQALEDEGAALQVICCVDVFSEGVDIPALTHVLLLRPTQSFTVFLQQLGRGLRRAPGKDYLVAIDFVGNYRQSHVARLALRGYASLEQFKEARGKDAAAALPRCCHVDADAEVVRIWDEDIRRSLRLDRKEMLKAVYWEMRGNLGTRSPQLLDFFGEPDAHDPYAFVREFGGWIRAKMACGDDLPPEEQRLAGTPAEDFLVHLEKDLRPVRCYKMVVLKTLLETDPKRSAWTFDEIARGFRGYFAANPGHAFDYPDLDRSGDPSSFPIQRVVRKLKEMPLKFLSNTESDFFAMDNAAGLFRLKATVAPFWPDPEFRTLCLDRVLFTLKRYFHRKARPAEAEAAQAPSESPSARKPGRTPEAPEVIELDHAAVAGREFSTALPLVGSIAAGPLGRGFDVESLDAWEDLPWVEVAEPLAARNRYVVRVAGRSMEPILRPGDLVVVEYHRTPRRDGQVVVMMASALDPAGDSVESIKRIRRSGAAWEFTSDNPSFPSYTIPMDEQERPILGIVVHNLTRGQPVR